MLPGEFKPLLTALVLPPAGPLLLALLGLLLMGRRWLGGAVVSLVGITMLWFLSCNAVGIGHRDNVQHGLALRRGIPDPQEGLQRLTSAEPERRGCTRLRRVLARRIVQRHRTEFTIRRMLEFMRATVVGLAQS